MYILERTKIATVNSSQRLSTVDIHSYCCKPE